MKKVLVIIALVSCVPYQYTPNFLANTYGNAFGLCSDHMYYYNASDLFKEYYIDNAFHYWDFALSRHVFSRGFSRKTSIMVDYDWFIQTPGSNYCVKSDLRFSSSGCLSGAYIHIHPECKYKRNKRVMETLIRHAIGNVLGLANVVDPGRLMCYELDTWAQHPIDASPEDIQAIKFLNGWE